MIIVMQKSDLKQFEEKMEKTIDALKSEFGTIRAGRASPSVLDKVHADYYGSMTPLSQMAAISVFEARTLIVAPWDKSALKAIEKAILTSDIGINPQNDGSVLRITFPPLTEERRKELVKLIKKYGEEAKVSVRNTRRDAIEYFKKQQKSSEITEDDLKIAEKLAQELTDKNCTAIDKLTAEKEKEILEI